MKIAIIGKICSGKSTCAKYLKDKYDFKIHSFGAPVKKYAGEIFNEKLKNRKLIQEFAQKVKEIDNDVWVNYLLNDINIDDNIVIDDLRFPNEYDALKKNGFIIIKLLISKEFQEQRIKITYPENFDTHLNRLNDISESFTNNLEEDYLFIVTKENENSLESFIDNLISKLIAK